MKDVLWWSFSVTVVLLWLGLGFLGISVVLEDVNNRWQRRKLKRWPTTESYVSNGENIPSADNSAPA